MPRPPSPYPLPQGEREKRGTRHAMCKARPRAAGTGTRRANSRYCVENRQIMMCRYVWPGLRTDDGKLSWFGESG